MNEEVILGMVQPYVKNNNLLYSDFTNLFEMLSVKEQCAVSDILEKHGITVLDVNDEDETDEGTFEVLYDASIFTDNFEELDVEQKDRESKYLRVNKKVSQSNEILCVLIQKGDMQAKQDLCTKNHGLVSKEANKLARYFGHDLEFDELVQAGMVGMLKAAEKFDISKGFQFTTYATWWIRQAIMREIGDYGFTIRIPIHMMERIAKVTTLDRKYEMRGMDYFERLNAISKELHQDIESVEYCLMLRANFLNDVSLDVPVGEDQETTLLEFLPNDEAKSVEQQAAENELGIMLREALSTLTEREQKIIILRFGLNDGRQRTLEEIGREFNVTRERIRQIEAKAIRKLRHPSRSRKFKDFFE